MESLVSDGSKVINARINNELRKLLFMVNYERMTKGLKPLKMNEFTYKIAKRYVNHNELIHDEFIKIP